MLPAEGKVPVGGVEPDRSRLDADLPELAESPDQQRPLAGGPQERDVLLGGDIPLVHADYHVAWLEAKGFAEFTRLIRRAELISFCRWCEERGVTRPSELTRQVLDLYQKRIAQARRKDGAPLSAHTQRQKLSAIAGFCRWLARERLLLYNPASEMELPRRGLRLPRTVLTVEEVEKVLAVPDTSTPLGLRDRAILETFYCTGIRRSELVNLTVHDLDLGRGILAVRHGKGDRDRFVPLGERALAWLKRYLEDVRPLLLTVHDPGALFLSSDGTGISPNSLGGMVAAAVTRADVGKSGACHLFRHTMATLMLKGGADIRFIQEMLGHAKLDTTKIYTRVSLHQLKAVHQATHPGANLKRRQANEHAEEQGETCPPDPTPAEDPAESSL